MSVAERKLIRGFRAIKPDGRRHVLRFVQALARGSDPEDVEFDLWFGQLARRKGLDRLTYKDVQMAVHRVRRGA